MSSKEYTMDDDETKKFYEKYSDIINDFKINAYKDGLKDYMKEYSVTKNTTAWEDPYTSIKTLKPRTNNINNINNINNSYTYEIRQDYYKSGVRVTKEEANLAKEYQELLHDIEQDEMIFEAWKMFVTFVKMRKDEDSQPSYAKRAIDTQ
jgi:hypothetical protein